MTTTVPYPWSKQKLCKMATARKYKTSACDSVTAKITCPVLPKLNSGFPHSNLFHMHRLQEKGSVAPRLSSAVVYQYCNCNFLKDKSLKNTAARISIVTGGKTSSYTLFTSSIQATVDHLNTNNTNKKLDQMDEAELSQIIILSKGLKFMVTATNVITNVTFMWVISRPCSAVVLFLCFVSLPVATDTKRFSYFIYTRYHQCCI